MVSQWLEIALGVKYMNHDMEDKAEAVVPR